MSSGIGAPSTSRASWPTWPRRHARRPPRVPPRELADELAGRGAHVEAIACDVADFLIAARWPLDARSTARGLTTHILVNNAGIGTIGSATQTRVADELLRCGSERRGRDALISTTRAVQRMVPRGRGGAILNVGSTAGYHPFPGQAGYAATKAFVKTYTRGCEANSPAPVSPSRCYARGRCAPSS